MVIIAWTARIRIVGIESASEYLSLFFRIFLLRELMLLSDHADDVAHLLLSSLFYLV